MKTIFKLIALSTIFCTFIAKSQAQVGSITTASTSCSLTIASCEGDTLTLTPQNQASYTNYKWYFGSVASGNEITATNAASNNVVATNFAANFPVINVISTGGTYILTGEYATPAGCSAINDTFQLNFTPRPTATNATLTLCEKTAGGGTADFTLTNADASITGGATGVAVTYHATLADARGDTNPLSSPYISGATTLYARVENTTTGCYRTATLTLNINSKPVIADGAVTICEGATVDLTGLITSYGTYSNPVWTIATVGGTSVSTPTAVKPSSTTTYILVAENGSVCKDTAQAVVTVNPRPVIADGAVTICEGATVDLTSLITSYGTYSNPVWTIATVGGTSVTTPTAVKPSATTTYILVAENGSVCKDTAQAVVTVNPRPVIADGVVTICEGATVDLTSLITSYGTYSNPVWTIATVGGTSVTTPTAVKPSSTTTYILVAENGSVCKDTAQAVVSVNPRPVIADGAVTICEGATVDLTGLITSYGTYSNPVWTIATVGGTSVTTPTAVKPSATTTYILVAENGSVCKDTAQAVVTVNPRPVIADGAVTICEGATVDLTSLITSYGTYSNPVWTIATVGGTSVTTPTAIKPSSTTTYILVAENGSVCKDTAQAVVTVNPRPVIADGAVTICEGATVDLTSLITSYGTYSNPVWTIATVGGTSVSTPTAVKPSSTTTYILVAENGSVCKDTAQAVVTVNPRPVIADGAVTICEGATVDLTSLITSYGTYSNPVWTIAIVGGTSVSTPTAVKPSSTTTYILVAENGSVCKDTAQAVVTVNPRPVIADGAVTICEGATVDLTSLITSYGTYSNPVWTIATVGGTSVTTPTAVKPSSTTTYILVAENGSVCKDTAQAVVTVNPRPVIADGAVTICEGATVDLTSLITSYGTYSNPVWTIAIVGGTSVSTPTAVKPSSTTTYILVAENGSVCKDTAQAVVTVNPKPVIADASSTICDGTSVDLTSLITGYIGYSNPVWTVATVGGAAVATPTAVTPSVTITYILVAQNGSGCKDTAQVEITVNPLPDFTLTKPVACPGTSEEVNVTIVANAVILTSQLSIDGGSFSAFVSPITGLSVATHSVILKNGDGCQTTKNIAISQPPAKICLPVIVTRSN